MEFKPIDPKGLSQERFRAEVANGINAIHVCVHTGQSEADKKREALAQDVSKIKGAVEILTGLLSDRSLAVTAKIGWREHLKIACNIGTCLGLFVLFYQVGRRVWPVIDAYLMGLSPT